ncbi:MAG: azurin [Steroidobacteraceae bacterium]
MFPSQYRLILPFVILLAGCGAKPGSEPAAAAPPAAAAASEQAAPAPAAAEASAAAATQAEPSCDLAISGNDLMQYDKKELVASGDCAEITVTLTHSGKLPKNVMGHNWVLTASADAQAVNNAGMTVGLEGDHVPANDARVIAHTAIVGGGESSTVKFPGSAVQKGGDYTFFCTFPGHFAVMRGTFVVK